MNFVLDMNLTPRWRGEFRRRGHTATHWSDVGSYTAGDDEIMRWAREHECIVFTHDLDFGTALALTDASGPSVIQVRSRSPLPETVGDVVFRAIARHATDLAKGALITVDVGRSRVRLLPLRGPNQT